MLPAAPLVADTAGALPTDAGEEGNAETAALTTPPHDLPPLQPSEDPVAAVGQRRLLGDFLAALRDAPRFGLLSYPPERLLPLLTDAADCRDVAVGLHAVRAWLSAWEEGLGRTEA
jgi:hypothetical protein